MESKQKLMHNEFGNLGPYYLSNNTKILNLDPQLTEKLKVTI